MRGSSTWGRSERPEGHEQNESDDKAPGVGVGTRRVGARARRRCSLCTRVLSMGWIGQRLAGAKGAESLLLTWAATVWDLVGKSLVTQAVLNPASERPNAARKPAPPAPTTTASNSWSTTGYCVEIWKSKIHSSIAHSTMPDIQAGVTVKELEENKRTQKKVPLSCPESLHPPWDREQQPSHPERRGAPLTPKSWWQSWCQAGPSILGSQETQH